MMLALLLHHRSFPHCLPRMEQDSDGSTTEQTEAVRQPRVFDCKTENFEMYTPVVDMNATCCRPINLRVPNNHEPTAEALTEFWYPGALIKYHAYLSNPYLGDRVNDSNTHNKRPLFRVSYCISSP